MKDLFIDYFHELIDVVPLGVYEVLLFVFFASIVCFITFDGIKKGWRKVVITLLVEYSFVLYCATVIFRMSNQVRRFKLTPLWSYTAISDGVNTMIPETVMNIVVFIPFGLLMGLAFYGANWKKVIFAGTALSLSIEFSQLLFKTGCCELDDIIHNSIGCLVGFCFFKLVRNIVQRVIFIKK